jgi:hypothetical protein
MIDIRALARNVIAQEWGFPGDVVDAMWATFATMPRLEGPLSLDARSLVGQHPLAGSPARTEQVAIAVFIFVQLAQHLTDDAKRDQVIAKLTELGTLLGKPGIVNRITNSLQNAFAKLDTVFATRYASDIRNSESLDEETARDFRDHPERYAIFIYHQRNLHPDLIGEVYFNGQSMRKDPTTAHTQGPERDYVTAREYAILRHLLKYHDRDDMRTAPDLIEYCWRQPDRARDARQKYNSTTNDRDEYHELTSGVRGTISKLSNILRQFLDVRLQSNETGIYRIVPSCTFCLIEEL